MKRLVKKAMAVCMSAILAMQAGNISCVEQSAKAATDYGLSNPRVEYQTCDCIYFGNYWQDDTNGDGIADQDDEKTPIKWRILEQDGDDLFLLADQALDCQPYNDTDEAVTWADCTLRDWLNNEFYNVAFTSTEQAAIKETNVVNEDNEEYGTDGGIDTTDRIYIFSISEAKNSEYGFQSDEAFGDQARQAEVTDYVKDAGTSTGIDNTSWWWLRSPGDFACSAAYVRDYGYVSTYGYDVYEVGDDFDFNGAVRPVLHVNAANFAISSSLAGKETDEIAVKESTWDAVTFGSYNGEEIIWRVLSVDGDDALLLADKALAYKACNEEYTRVTWETCTLRNWLNGDFYKEAFTVGEQAAIQETTLKNEDNPFYKTEGGEDTMDNIWLLSLSDVVNTSYGFPTSYGCESSTRTAYDADGNTLWWWLRSPGDDTTYATYVYDYGIVDFTGDGVSSDYNAVRPALHLNLSSSVWEYAGTVSSDDEVNSDDNSEFDVSEGSSASTSEEGGDSSDPVTSPSTSASPSPSTPKEDNSSSDTTVSQTKDGQIVTDNISKATYKVISASAKTVQYQKPTQKTAKKASIPATITISGTKYKVAEVANNAFKGMKKLKAVTIGKNVKKIGAKAFYGCKKLKTITFQGKKLKKVGKQAFKNIVKKAVFATPKSKLKAYKKLLNKKAGVKKTMKVKKS